MDFDYFEGEGETAVDNQNVGQQGISQQDEDEFDFAGTYLLN